MKSSSSGSEQNQKVSPIPSVIILAIVLMTTLWAMRYFSAEARVHRATVRMIRTVEKTGEESPVSLGLAANRFGEVLASHVVLELEEVGVLTNTRQETVQLFARIRNSVTVMTFSNPVLLVKAQGKGLIGVHVKARYLFDSGTADEEVSGHGTATLTWAKGKDGWQIVQAVLQAEKGTTLPKGWK